MKKVFVLTLCLVFLVNTTTAFAADEKIGWMAGFSRFFSFMDFFRPPMPPIGRDDVTTTLTITPKVDRKPTRFERVLPIESPEDRENRGNAESGRPTGVQEPSDNTNGPRGSSGNIQNNRIEDSRSVVDRIVANYENRLSNYQDFLTKVTSRRDKLSADGADVAKLDIFIQTATGNLTKVRQKLTDAKNTASGIDYTGSMQDIRSALRTPLSTLRQAMTDLHKSMSQSVSSISEASVKNKASGTPALRGTQRQIISTMPRGRGKPEGPSGEGN